MRTTLDIDDDVLAAARELAKAEGKTMGEVISELVRLALTSPSIAEPGFAEPGPRFGVPVWHTLPNREGVVVTPELIERVQAELDREDAAPWDHAKDEPRKL